MLSKSKVFDIPNPVLLFIEIADNSHVVIESGTVKLLCMVSLSLKANKLLVLRGLAPNSCYIFD